MRRDAQKYLFDVRRATDRIARFCNGKQFVDYQRDELLRSGVERQFEIVGEALSQLAKNHPDVAAKIPSHARIIAFRNILIHGYATVDDRIVWGVVETHLRGLQDVVEGMLSNR